MTLKDIIINYRTEHNLSQREFSVLCGLSNAAISIIEKDKINPKTGKKTITSIETLMKLASGMGMSIDELFEKMDNNIPLRMSFPDNRQSFHPAVIEMLDKSIKKEITDKKLSQQEEDIEAAPKTEEARILSRGIDQLPEEQRKQAVAMFELMFSKFITLKEKNENET